MGDKRREQEPMRTQGAQAPRSDIRSDRRLIGDVREWADKQGLEWTTDPIESATADFRVLPGRLRPRCEPDRGRSPPGGADAPQAVALGQPPARAGDPERARVRTRVLALLDEHTPKRWIRYGNESQGPGSEIEAAVRFAERSGLRSLAIGPGTEPSLGEREAREAMERAAASPITRLIVHSGPVSRWPAKAPGTE